MSPNPPVIGFELGVGEFRIVTPEAVYQIRVLPELVVANTDLGVLSPRLGPEARSPEAPPPAAPGPAASPAASEAPADMGFFQEISQELFDRVGQLARQLSISVGEIPDAPGAGGAKALSQSDLSETGHALEDAKGQLEEVVEITERASMTIMDLADQIQADMDSLNRQMASLAGLESLLGAMGAEDEAPEAGGSAALMDKLAEIKNAADKLPPDPGGAAPSPPAPAPAQAQAPAAEPAPPVPVVVFDLGTVFQTLYEFCTNESVKDHIKAMTRGHERGAFESAAVEAEMSSLAKTLEPDDGFYNFPIPALLRTLYANTSDEEFRTTLKKMNQTAASIFLEADLPLEGREELVPAAEIEPAAAEGPGDGETAPGGAASGDPASGDPGEPASAEPGGSADSPEGPAAAVKRLAAELLALGPTVPGPGEPKGVPAPDRQAILKAVTSSDQLVKSTTRHLTRIMEALSFQDLSGQRIKRIVSLIGEIQVQLLSMLVSVNSKIKAHHESPAAPRPKEETEKVAQAEVDKMLERLAAEPSSELMGPGADNRLDQGAVNDLLAQLGF